MTRTFAVAAGAALALISAPALAESRSVKFHDLDLASQAGAKELDRRIDAAAKETCGWAGVRTGSRMASKSVKSCLETARASARKQVAEAVGSAATAGG